MTLPIIFADGTEGFVVLAIIGFFVLVAGLIAVSLYWEAQRVKALTALAEEMGLNFSRSDHLNIRAELADTHLFSKGSGKSVANIIWGQTADTEVAIFEYSYQVESHNSSENTTSTTTHTQTVVRFRSRDLALPAFSMRPKNFFHRLGTLFGYQAITFEEYPTFSQRWLLRGKDERAVTCLFRPESIQFFEEERGLGVEGYGNLLMVYREDKRLAPEAIRAFLEESWQVFALFRTNNGDQGA